MTRTAPLERWLERSVEAWRADWGLPALEIHARISSTNSRARELAEAGAPAATTVLADTQTAGRGRLGRAWVDRPGESLLLSMVLRPMVARGGEASLGTVPLRVGLAAADAIGDLGLTGLSLKWPNDLLLGGRKLGGILCEGSIGSSGGFIVAGIGLNVAQAEEAFPAELRGRAISLASAGVTYDRSALAAALIRRLLPLATHALAPLAGGAASALAARDVLRGRDVAITEGGREALRGRADGIDADGALRVRLADGSVRRITAGTVRPASEPDPGATPA